MASSIRCRSGTSVSPRSARIIPAVKTDQYHIDILTAHFVRHPDWFDVVVGSNLFGDILSDLGPAVVGSIGIAPGGNINPERELPSMFEPVHGSAPDIAGRGIANPIGQVWSGAMMLDHLGEHKAAGAAIEQRDRARARGSQRTDARRISAAMPRRASSAHAITDGARLRSARWPIFTSTISRSATAS